MPEDPGRGFKYGALILYPPSGPREPRAMHGGKETFAANILSLVPPSEHDHWRTWVGSIAWSGIERAERIVVMRASSLAPSVMNEENQRLERVVSTAWTAFLLCGETHSDDPAWIMTGEAAGDGHGAQLLTLRTVSQQDRVVHPFYATRPRYLKVQADALGKHWQTYGKADESWFQRWVDIDDLLCRRAPIPTILGYTLLSYGSARSRRLLEFSIPEFVRAAEGVIALERNMGAKVFQQRALRLAPSLLADEYVGSEVEALLPELYQLRSDCVHGKLPFLKLQVLGTEGEDRAAQLAYAAEVLAREALLVALRHSDRSIFESREDLERAWANGTFPGGQIVADDQT